jgi:hypothetical protein
MAMILAGLRVWIKVNVGVGRIFIDLLHGRLHLADAPFGDFGHINRSCTLNQG